LWAGDISTSGYDFHASSLVLLRPDGHIGYRGALDALSTYAHHLDEFYTRVAEA
jgi:hypothetical protein